MEKGNNLENFKAGRFEKGFNYQYFVPNPINQKWFWQDAELNSLLERASFKLGELNSFARLVPDVNLFIQLHVTKEAVVSSKIEGTQTNMNEAFMPEDSILAERKHDWQEVRNYTDAMNFALGELNTLPVSSRLIKSIHQVLLDGVRGENKLPGQYRSSQNWIGGASLKDAVFIPPAHDYVNGLMGDLENFVHNTELNIPVLIKAGIMHYQFETIHPFLDGNGRVGRLLISLYMVSENLLHLPLLYLSVFFEKNRQTYYDNLMLVRQKNDMIRWLKFFLVGVEETAVIAVDRLKSVLDLKAELEKTVAAKYARRASSSYTLLSYLFKKPVIYGKDVQVICNLSRRPSYELLEYFVETGILKEIGSKQRDRIFIFDRYMQIFES